ncbi:LysR substrate-binding domain-containing protein [Phenylobacterium sp.]|uniref:LysR substrate-binding domain-containing protein n=1 Tax=Phenylobacterium sp. TaxID=1871053 RepID=UPI00289BBB53|nr:LysR substrate-binding domain-containing protein [Phenylobacterium sp.]
MADILASIPLSAIRVFEAAARLRSFTRAAEELGVTQAAVSWQVKALEKRLDQALFLRLPREVALTAAGERLSRAASEAMAALRTALSDLTETGEGVLAITTVHTMATQWLAPRIGGFQLAHPKIAVRLDTSGHLVDLARENMDVALRNGEGAWPGLESHYLFPHIHTPLCTPAMRARLGGLHRPQDLLGAPLIGAPEEWEVWFAAAGVGERRPGAPRLAGDSQTLEIASALGEQGVALASPILFAADIAAGRLVAPFETYAHYGGGYWLAYPADRGRAPKIRAFREWVLDCVAKDPVLQAYPRRER